MQMKHQDIEKLAHIETEIFDEAGELDLQKLQAVLKSAMCVMEFSISAQEMALRYLDDVFQQIEVAGKE